MGLEILLILLVGWLILGGRQMTDLLRTAAEWTQQARAAAGNLTQQLDEERAQQEAEARRAALPAAPVDDTPTPLPEAFRRFQQDFPDEDPLRSVETPPAQPDAPTDDGSETTANGR